MGQTTGYSTRTTLYIYTYISNPLRQFKRSSYRFCLQFFVLTLFRGRLNFSSLAQPCAGFQNDPTSSYLRAPSCSSRGCRGRSVWGGWFPQSAQASLNGPYLIRHRRLILKNPERDKPFLGQSLLSTPDLRGSYEPL